MIRAFAIAVCSCAWAGWAGAGEKSGEPPKATTLSDPTIRYVVPKKPYVVLRRGPIEAVIVDHRAVDDDVLPGHQAGYSGLAKLTHTQRKDNLFVPTYAGLNFEHIIDGTAHQDRDRLFEPRRWPMELRQIHPHIVELYQSPTPTYGVESCQRFELLDDGALQLTIEVIPHKKAFRFGYLGLFWASYIHQPENGGIHFLGWPSRLLPQNGGKPPAAPAQWIHSVSPAHGKWATHLSAEDRREFPRQEPFPLTLVFNLSDYRYAEPWYFGVSHGMALAFVFRKEDQVRFSQSPSGGGKGNPAWDFQFLIPDVQIKKRYQFVLRIVYLPYESPQQVQAAVARHLRDLNPR
ncbi:MAG: hypothetical protein N3E46_13685 [Gemmataceae bacterium]|uniref:DUF5107 domain-containing protein n=1 Tax=Thermogemmata fonticola TaxID=2755323 RepID=A0A7V8VEZ0_9BACT|nr:hypothetical protein [Thermogemmata fonticola]MBA2226798.1 hypothetical protein [Thermogemmata fonticola]MCX8140726.1 hypothetical protein [Gemmataceae bacterium]